LSEVPVPALGASHRVWVEAVVDDANSHARRLYKRLVVARPRGTGFRTMPA
jgi:hypothetical protein